MAALGERVGQLEGRMLEQSQGISELKDSVAGLDAKLTDSVARLDAKLTDSVVRLDTKISDTEARLDAKISDSVARLDDKISRQFVWLVGMLVTVLAAVVGGLLSQ